ncbi:MAG: 50S ribosomal protein L21 [Eggerthellaceae bacterium]
MYAIVKTGGKQYKVAPGDKINIEKLNVEPGDKVELEAICVVDGDKVEADPEKAAKTKVVATVLEQFKGDKALVFKFKKRKNYKLRGHRQQLTRVQIESSARPRLRSRPSRLRRRTMPRRSRLLLRPPTSPRPKTPSKHKEGIPWHTRRVSVPAVTAAIPTRSVSA